MTFRYRRVQIVLFLVGVVVLSAFVFLRGDVDVDDGWSGSGSGRFEGAVDSKGGLVGAGGSSKEQETQEQDDHTAAETIAGNMVAALTGPGPGTGKADKIPASLLDTSMRKELRVAVVESGGGNEEGAAALIYAFGRQLLAPISLYLFEPRFQIGDIIRDFDLPIPIVANKSSRDFAEVVRGEGFPQLLVSSSCEIDLLRLHDSFDALREAGKTYLYCVVHDADAWREGELVEKIRPWVRLQMVDFVTLSSHTAHHFRTQAIANWDFNATVTVQWLPPVFPVTLSEKTEGEKIKDANRFPFALYTDADPEQNNYTDIFASLVPVLEQAKNVTNDVDEQHSRTVQLQLLGRHEAPKIPSALKRDVIYNPTQSYRDYYTQLSQTFALVPYLPLPTYLTSRTSSAIPAALIAGAPLIANVELLEAYSYVPQDAVWVSTSGEGEMDTVMRVVQWSAPEYWRKRRVVRERCARIIRRNEEVVAGWVEQAQRRIERAGWRMKVKGGGDL